MAGPITFGPGFLTIPWNRADWEMGGNFWDASDPTRIYAPREGLYFVSANLSFTQTVTDVIISDVTGVRVIEESSSGGAVQSCQGLVYCWQYRQLSIQVYSSASGNVGNAQPHVANMQMYRLGSQK
jgi:hypothetical protein